MNPAKQINKSRKPRQEAVLLVGGASATDLAYLGLEKPPETMLLLRARGGVHAVVPALEYGRVAGLLGAEAVDTPQSLGLTPVASRCLSRWAAVLLDKAGLRQVRVANNFPLGLARAIEKQGFRLQVVRGNLLPERVIKRRDEVQNIRQAQQAAVIAMRMATTMIGEAETTASGMLRYKGKTLTSERLRLAMARVLMEHGCLCEDLIVAAGRQGADPHERGHGPIMAGAPIVIDVFPRHIESGYWGDLTRTVVRGRAHRRVKRMYQAVKAAHHAALSRVRPGVLCADVHRAAADTLKRYGFKTGLEDGLPVGFIHSTGHGVGRDVHESPSIGVNPQCLDKGHVVTIEPGLYYPDLGGVRIEDTVVVTAQGWRYLVPCEKRFEL